MHTEKECSITGLLLYPTALLTFDICRKKIASARLQRRVSSFVLERWRKRPRRIRNSLGSILIGCFVIYNSPLRSLAMSEKIIADDGRWMQEVEVVLDEWAILQN